LQEEVAELLRASGFTAMRITRANGEVLINSQHTTTQNFFSQKNNLRKELPGSSLRFVRGTDNKPYLIIQEPVFRHSAQFQNAPIGLITLTSNIEEIDDLLSTSKWPMALFNQKKEAVLNFPTDLNKTLHIQSAIQKGVLGDTGIEDINNHLIAFRYIAKTGGALVALIDKEEILEPMTQLTVFFTIGGLVTIIAVIFIASGASRKIVKPIKDLLRGVNEVTSGNFEATVHTASGDEIESLGNRFNEMIIKIKDRNKDLTDFKYALDQAAIVAITDQEGIIQYANDRFCEVSKYSRNELIGQDHRIIKSGSHSKEFIKNLWETIKNGKVWSGHLKNKAKDGSFYWVDSTIVPFLNQQGKPYQYLAIRTDITQRKIAEGKIRHLAQYDELTHLPNRTLFNERLNQTLKQRSWGKRPFAVMFLDLDRFKLVNDTLGHTAGDALLQQVSDRLTACLRAEDTVARMGGDEFTILLPAIAKAEDAFLVAQKVVATLKKPFKIAQKELIATGSIGISLYPENGENAETLLKNADAAMYRAKENGRGRFSFYMPATKARKSNKLELISALSHAIEREELLLNYQCFVDMKNGNIVGMETLIRWQRGNKLISPAEFIPLAEESGLILPIGDWVLRTATAQLKSWQDAGYRGLCLSVNVAAPQFQEADFVDSLEEIIKEVGIAPTDLKLELTESLLMKNQEEVITKLKDIKSSGVQLAIDDFGTGYSSLSYLKRFPVDTLKIDQSFVRNIPENPDDSAIAEMILTLAAQLKLNVVAEGIETKAQFAFLQMRGCDMAQGYLFNRPVPAEEFTMLLERVSERKTINGELFYGIENTGIQKDKIHFNIPGKTLN
ncbi:MAG: EAL domain-containing protein, partial [Nitrospiria bacterium]